MVATIGLSTGVLAAVFAFVDPMLWRPLPMPDADRIVVARAEGEQVRMNQLQAADYFRLLEPTTSFEAVGSFYGAGIGEIRGLAQQRFLYAVTPGFLRVAGVAPVLGRPFRSDEHREKPTPVILIAHDVWRDVFALSPDVVGRMLEMRDWEGHKVFEIVGVLPEGFIMPGGWAMDLAGLAPGQIGRGAVTDWRVRTPIVARLRPGVSIREAEAELRAVAAQAERQYPTLPQGRTIALVPLRTVLFGDVATVAMLLFLGAAGVVLVAIANLAHLIRSRLRAREQELAVRAAIGASRLRLLRLPAIEIGLLAGAGAILAIGVGHLGLAAITRLVPQHESSYRLLPTAIDLRVIVVMLLMTAATAFAIYVWAIAGLIRGPLPELGTARATSRLAPERLLVFTQAAIVMALTVCGVQVSAAFLRMQSQIGDFDPRDFTLLSVSWSGRRAHNPDMHDLQRRSSAAVEDAFGSRVSAFGFVPGLGGSLGSIRRPGSMVARGRPIDAVAASADAFQFLDLRLLAGRLYTEAEAWSDAPVAVADRRAAELLWPGESPIGKRVVDGTDYQRDVEREIVGLVETLPRITLPGTLQKGSVFVPFNKTSQGSFNFLFREGPGAPPLSDVRRVLERVDPAVLVAPFPYLPHERQVGQTRFVLVTLLTFSTMTLLLAAIGLFGMISNLVVSRTREIAIRVALGALPSAVKRLLVARHMLAAGAGIVLGAGLALRASTLLDDIRFDVRPDAAWTFAAAGALLLAATAVASYLPARRAIRIDPAQALKAE